MCIRDRPIASRQVLSADRAARRSSSRCAREERRGDLARRTAAAFQIQGHRLAGVNRATLRCRGNSGNEILGNHRLVAMARDLPQQASRVSQKSPRGTRLDARFILLEEYRPVANADFANNFGNGKDIGCHEIFGPGGESVAEILSGTNFDSEFLNQRCRNHRRSGAARSGSWGRSWRPRVFNPHWPKSVSYTHLDVYKRQAR